MDDADNAEVVPVLAVDENQVKEMMASFDLKDEPLIDEADHNAQGSPHDQSTGGYAGNLAPRQR